MKLQIIEENKVLFEIENVDKTPYGIQVVNSQGGVSLSPTLRQELSKFLLEYIPAPKKLAKLIEFTKH